MPIPQIKSPQTWRKNQTLRPQQTNWRKKVPQKTDWRNWFCKKNIILASFSGLALLIIASSVLFLVASNNLPDPNKLMEREIAESTKIFDRSGQTILYEIHGNEKRTLVTLNDIPKHLQQATIAIEDKDYYTHGGFSVWALFRTAVTNVLFGKKAGGSTLTQQFIKNAVLTNEKTYIRKLKELILAYRIEQKFSKDEILQMYFNEIPYGSNAYGVETASMKYFGKHVNKINLPEAAILAALPQAPTKYSPFGPNKETLLARQRYILDLMVKQNMISKDEAEVAKNVKLSFQNKDDNNILAPHFVMYIKQILAEKYGDKMIEQGGLRIYTTLDLPKQKIAEEIVKEQALKNEVKYNASNAALVSIDPKNGQVLAMVGSRDYWDEKIDGQVNIALASRQPGSSFKPIVYAAAFMKGFNPNTILYDVVTNFSSDPTKTYEPHNYNGKEYGPISMRQALAGSLNTPAVKTLYLAGLDNVLKLAKNLGYTTLGDKDRFGLSLVLGGGEVRLLDHVNAYSALAREGLIHQPAFILKIEDRNKNVLEEFKLKEDRVFEPNIARMVNSILTDNSARAYIFGEKNLLTLPNRQVAAKTGTTNDFKDAWIIGYTPSIVTGVWTGNNDNKSLKAGSDGSMVAAPIWNAYMSKILGNTPAEIFKTPEIKLSGKSVIDGVGFGETKVKIDKASGLLATELTPASFTEEKIFKQVHNILYYINKDEPLGDYPKDPSSDSQYSLWETRVQEWAVKQKIDVSTPPTEFDNLHKPEYNPVFSISGITNNQIINNQNLIVNFTGTAPRGINRVEYYLNNNILATNYNYPFNLDKSLNFLDSGLYDLKIKTCDDIDNCSEQKLTFNYKNSQTTNNIPITSWSEPANNSKLKLIPTPIKVSLNLINPEVVGKVTIYQTLKGQPRQALKSFEMVTTSFLDLEWLPGVVGSFQLDAEVINWQGQLTKTPTLNLTIK